MYAGGIFASVATGIHLDFRPHRDFCYADESCSTSVGIRPIFNINLKKRGKASVVGALGRAFVNLHGI